jgi:hypothetical protein
MVGTQVTFNSGESIDRQWVNAITETHACQFFATGGMDILKECDNLR